MLIGAILFTLSPLIVLVQVQSITAFIVVVK